MTTSGLVSSFFFFHGGMVGVPEEEAPLGRAEFLHDTPEPGDQRGVAVHTLDKESICGQQMINT
jgi:hypothetical protein